MPEIPPSSLRRLGYDHLLTNVVPAMRRLGIGTAELDAMLRDNPSEYLAF